MLSKAEWLDAMAEIFTLAAGLLRPQGYLLTFIGDMYRENRYHCLSAELAGALSAIPGLVWKANLVWYDVSKKLHLYGYQYSYIPSLIHQNILVFRRKRGLNLSVAAVDGNGDDRPAICCPLDRRGAAPLPSGRRAHRSLVPTPPTAGPRGAPNSVVELDRNGDGKVDYRVVYDQSGAVLREEMDFNFDGKMDTFYYYKSGVLQRVEIDSNNTGRIDIWVYLLDGKYVQRYERDTNGDGKPDLIRVFDGR